VGLPGRPGRRHAPVADRQAQRLGAAWRRPQGHHAGGAGGGGRGRAAHATRTARACCMGSQGRERPRRGRRPGRGRPPTATPADPTSRHRHHQDLRELPAIHPRHRRRGLKFYEPRDNLGGPSPPACRRCPPPARQGRPGAGPPPGAGAESGGAAGSRRSARA
jgi:hypothetical protein